MYDVIIIGGGPSGISASLYTQRANKKTLVICQENTSLEKANNIENYYGFENGISGKDLYNIGIKQAEKLGVVVAEEEVVKIEMSAKGFCVSTQKSNYFSKAVIIAIGVQKNKPNIKGIKELEGKGVSYCAICDGFLYRNKNVAVIGSGNYALSETNDLINLANKVTILTNGEQKPEFRADNVEMISKPIDEVVGEERIREVRFKDGSNIKVDGAFIAQGTVGSVELAKKLGLLTKDDKIVVNDKMETNIKGIYACGDCTGGLLQISKAVYEGMIAAMEVNKYLK